MMSRLFLSTALALVAFTFPAWTQTKESLRQKIQEIISGKQATVGVALAEANRKDTVYVNGHAHFPMQSVFKLHIGLAVLEQVDRGKFSLDQKIKIEKKDLLPGLHSPIRDQYPDGAVLSISEILEYTISQSDNAGCDVLLRLMGGPPVVEAYFARHNFKNVSIKINEETMQSAWDLQFQNWTTPHESNQVLKTFYDNKSNLLSRESHDFFWKVMTATSTGPKRIKGQLPQGTVVAHKAGTSGTQNGVMAAVNDIGIVFLPDGSHFFISVFVSNSKEDFATNERMIADIAKAAWDYFETTGK